MHRLGCHKQQWAGERLKVVTFILFWISMAVRMTRVPAGSAQPIACKRTSQRSLDMSRQNHLDGDALAWLLAPDSPGVRYLALRDLLDTPSDDPELRAAAQAAHAEGPIA